MRLRFDSVKRNVMTTADDDYYYYYDGDGDGDEDDDGYIPPRLTD